MNIVHFINQLRDSNIDLSLVEDNLEISYDGEGLPDAVLNEIRHNKTDIVSFLKRLTPGKESAIPVAGFQKDYPASFSQERIWGLSQLEDGNLAYNIPGTFVLEGKLDPDALQHALNALVARHEVLRTIFREDGQGALRQYIRPAEDRPLTLACVDLRSKVDQDVKLKEGIRTAVGTPFDLRSGPLLRASLYRLHTHRWIFVYVIHHIICDGWSVNILMKELLLFYNACTLGTDAPLPPLKFQFKDYTIWQRQQAGNELISGTNRSYWLRQFSGELPVLNLPADKPRPAIKTYRGTSTGLVIDVRTCNGIRSLCLDQGASLFMGLIGIVNVLLYRYTGQKDIILGTPIAGRDHTDLEDQIGFYANTLALRTRFEGKDSFKDILAHVRQMTLGAYEHQAYPFDRLVEDLSLRRDLSRNPLFDVLVVLQNTNIGYGKEQQQWDELGVTVYQGEPPAVSRFDLSVYFVERGGELAVTLEYNNDIYTDAAIGWLGRHLVQLIKAVTASPSLPVLQLDYLSPEEKRQLITGFNDTAMAYPEESTLVGLFEEQVTRTPEKIALVADEETISFHALNGLANQLGHFLRQQYGIEPGDLVAIRLERSKWQIIAILGLLKSGGAYVPIDPSYPQDRVDYILSDSNCKILMDDRLLEEFIRECNGYDAGNKAPVSSPGDPAYVIYTSGSTGRPKGCLLEHRGVVNRIIWMWQHYSFQPEDVILQKTPFTFDVSVWEIFMPLCRGARMVLCRKEDARSPEHLLALIQKEKVTGLHFVPGMLHTFISFLSDQPGTIRQLQSLQKVFTSGEALPAEMVQRWYSKVKIPIHNLYGPTEASVDVTYYATSPKDNRIPIGRPIWNTQLYILDEINQPVPIGITGEIGISGVGLARGYLNRGELSGEKFVAHPFREGARLYKTGDLGRWLPDGNIEFLGRIDDQVKIRGYRIEPGEIEAALSSHPEVEAAIVTVKTDKGGDKDLVAWFVSAGDLDISALRAYLGKVLPAYMLPAYYVRLEKLPLSPNGKIDRRLLPDPEGWSTRSGIRYVPPGNETESRLVAIWEELLASRPIGIKDDFFMLGGHSLKATRLATHISRTFNVVINLHQLFELPVLEDQVKFIQQARLTAFRSIPAAAASKDYPLSFSQRRLWVLCQFGEVGRAYHLHGEFIFEGSLDLAALEYAFHSLVTRHEILRTVFREDERGEVRQVIKEREEQKFVLFHEDLQKEEEVEDLVRNKLLAEGGRPFDLATGPLWRAGLYQVAANRWVFLYVMHHIISDGWSMDILVRELLQLYNARIGGEADNLVPLEIQYKDYAIWQREQQKEPSLEDHRSYWLEQFKGELPVLDLPGDRPRPAIKTFDGAITGIRFDPGVSDRLRSLCRQQGCTLYMGLLAAVNLLLYKYTGHKDLIIGSPIAGRDHIDLEDQIGFYTQTLAMRTRFSEEDTYPDLLARVRKVALGAFEHQHYPFDELLDELHLERDRSRNYLFDVLVHLQDARDQEKGRSLGALTISPYNGQTHVVSKFDLSFTFTETDNDLSLYIEYSTDLFDEATIRRMCAHMRSLLGSILSSPATSLARLDYLETTQRDQLLIDFNQAAQNDTGYQDLIALIRGQATRRPDQLALKCGTTRVTYRELDESSDRLANHLVQDLGVQPGWLIGIMLDRSVPLIIGLLGILKAGAAYVPIEPDYPPTRKQYILRDAGINILLTQTAYMPEPGLYEGFALDLETRLKELPGESPGESRFTGLRADPDNPAYIIYTSGSSGTPKGCAITHGNFSNYVQWANRHYFDGTSPANFGFFTALSFDLTVTSIFCSLTQGGLLTIYGRQIGLPEALADNFREASGINSIKLTPSHISLLKSMNLSSPNVLRAIVGGEQVTPGQVGILKSIHPGMAIYNEYGPTETTVGCTVALLEEGQPVLVGKPVSNTFIYVLGQGDQLSAIGLTGEICIGGAGLARGYVNNPTLTAEKFVANPFRPGERMYRTGDLGKWLPDGNLVFIGRKDDQVKIRGYRIEPGEIEAVLQGHEKINAAAVLVRTRAGDEKELVAYIAGKEKLPLPDLHAYLALHLPSWFIPAHFVQLGELPLTPNGKVDRKQLPDPESRAAPANIPYVAPRNKVEEHLVLLWQELLGKKHIGVKDDFFGLGAHSLHVLRLAANLYSRFHVKVSLKELFEKTVLEDLASFIQHARKVAFLAIPPAPVQKDYPLSSSQRRLWTVSQLENETIAYNMPGVYLFEGELNADALDESFRDLLQRHESLRTAFRQEEHTDTRQIILPAEEVPFQVEKMDLRGEDNPRDKANSLVQQESLKPFDLTMAPLIRATLYRLSDHQWVFGFVIHHMVCDGWSLNILIKELLSLYHAKCEGAPDPLLSLGIHYKDYATWQQQLLTGGEFKGHRAYWLKQLEGDLPVLDLPGDKGRPVIKTNNGAAIKRLIDAGPAGRLKDLVRRRGSTLFMGLLAVVRTLLYRYTQQTDLIIGTQVAGREHIDLEDQVGLYLNALALRTPLQAGNSFLDLLEKVREVITGAFAHQAYPFDALVEELHLVRDMSRNPLFDVIVALENNAMGSPGEGQELPGLHISGYGGKITQCKFDLAFHFTERGNDLELILVYNSYLYLPSTIDRMGDHVVQLLEAILLDPAASIGQLEYLSIPERQQLLKGFNSPQGSYPQDKTIVDLFAEQVLRTPENMAVVFEGAGLTYRELNKKANRLAHTLRAFYQVGPNDLVAVMLDRSADMLVAILAILKAGAAYVPIDPEFPPSRITYLLNDTGAEVLLTSSSYRSLTDQYKGAVFFIDNSLLEWDAAPIPDESRVRPEDPAYVIYTSGSTGQPKGVVISHRSLVDYFFGLLARTNIRDCVHFGMVSTIAADLGNTVLFASLLTGGTLHVYTAAALLDAEAVFDGQLDCIKIVPSHWKSLQLENKTFLPAKCLIFGGEQFTPEILRTIRSAGPRCQVYNHYGPTETTIGKLINAVDLEHSTHAVPLGSPFCDSAVYILDEQDKLMPQGVIGEICIAGAGLAYGYINKPEQTAEKFAPNPFTEGGRMYRTGDLGRWLADGTIVFFGRKDDQVKIRGYRVELGEIENTLRGHPDIDSSFVRAREGKAGDKELIAYVVSRKPSHVPDLRAWLARALPPYMLPDHFVALEHLPLTPNGKVDRKRLPEPDDITKRERLDYTAPANDIEQTLVRIWEGVLAREKIGVTDDYFELGGNSLKVIGILKKTMDETGVAIPIKTFFEKKTIRQIAGYITAKAPAPLVKKTETPAPASPRPGLFYEASYSQLTFLSDWKSGNPLVITPYEFDELDVGAFTSAVRLLIERQEVLRTKFVRIDGEIRQQVLPAASFPFEITDPVPIPTEDDLQRITRQAHSRKLDPFTDPLFLIEVYRLSDSRYFMLVTMHHAITDGHSDGILRSELLQLYNGILQKEPVPLKPLPFQYRDFVKWQRDFVHSPEGVRHQEYWFKKLQGFIQKEGPDPEDSKGETVPDFGKSIWITRVIDEKLYEELDLFTRKNGLTRTAFLMAGLMLLVSRLRNLDEVTLFVPVSGRDSKYYGSLDISGLIGYFVNALLVRSVIPQGQPVIEYLQEVQQGFLDDLSFDAYPIEKLIHELPGIEPATFLRSRVAFNYHNYTYLNQHDYTIREGERKGAVSYKEPAQPLLGVVVREYRNCLRLELIFDHRRFAPARALEITDDYFSLLQQIIDASQASVATIIENAFTR